MSWHSAAVDSVGNAYVTGQSNNEANNSDYATVKYDTDGNELWVRRYDGLVDYSNDFADAIAVDSSGNVYVAGGSNYDYATVKYSQMSVSIGGLIDLINELPEDALDEELVNSLTQKLENAEKQATKENICAAVNILGAFQNQVEAQRGNKIADATATFLIEYSENVITQLLEMLPEGETCSTT